MLRSTATSPGRPSRRPWRCKPPRLECRVRNPHYPNADPAHLRGRAGRGARLRCRLEHAGRRQRTGAARPDRLQRLPSGRHPGSVRPPRPGLCRTCHAGTRAGADRERGLHALVLPAGLRTRARAHAPSRRGVHLAGLVGPRALFRAEPRSGSERPVHRWPGRARGGVSRATAVAGRGSGRGSGPQAAPGGHVPGAVRVGASMVGPAGRRHRHDRAHGGQHRGLPRFTRCCSAGVCGPGWRSPCTWL